MKAGTLNGHLGRGRELAYSKHEEPLVSKLERAFVEAGKVAARNFAEHATEHLVAAAAAPTATMIAVYPAPEEAVVLALPNGEPVEILHCTLAFLGDTDPDQAEAAVAVVRRVAAEMGPLSGVVGGVASFGAEPGAEEPLYPSIALPDVPGLAELRQAVCDALAAAGIEWAQNHGWTPHVTLAYTPEPSPPSMALVGQPLTFDRLTLARGDVPRDFVLGAGLTAAGNGPASWSAPHADEVIDVEAFVRKLRTKTDPVRKAAIENAMALALAGVGIDFDATNPLVAGVLAGSGAQVTHIAETTRLNVMRSIREAYEQGLTIPDTAKLIQAGMSDAGPARARLIARTELAGVVNGGAVAAAEIVGSAADVMFWKRWLTAEGADYPRHEDYEGLDGQTVELDGVFDVGGARLEYPGDPGGPPEEICNCRCTVIMVESPDQESDVGLAAAAPLAALPSSATNSGGNVKSAAVSTVAPSIFERRQAVRESLLASGDAEPKLVATYEMTYGSLCERWFIQAAIEAGYTEVTHDNWPTESEHLENDDRIVFREGDHGAVYRLEDGTIALVDVGHGRCRVQTAGPALEVGQAACTSFRSLYPASYLVNDGDARVPITFWMNGRFGPTSRLRKIEAATWSDVDGNYPAAIRDELGAVMAWENGPPESNDGQLLLFQGEPGTGKTWVLRALASEWADWAEFHYITDPDAFFCEGSAYMVDVLLSDSYDVIDPATGQEFSETDPEGKWRVLILEDTGELLAANAKEAYGQGLSRLLNVVDGMIGQGLRVLAIVTTNDELGDLHPAVKRDGRCAVSLEFGGFTAEEASAWLGETVEEGGTLAELYARKFGRLEPRELAEGETLEEGELVAGGRVELGARTGLTAASEVIWAPEDGFYDLMADIGEALNPRGEYRYCVYDVALALDRCIVEDWETGECWVVPLTMDGDAPVVAPASDWIAAETAWVRSAEASAERVKTALASRAAIVAAAEVTVTPSDVRPEGSEAAVEPPAVEPRTNAGQVRWQATLLVEGKMTEDGRYIEPGATTWRELPLSLMAQLVTADGHDEARIAGRIDEIWRGAANPDGSVPVFGSGIFDDSEFGHEVARLVGDRVLRGNSVDLAIRSFELAYPGDFDENGHRVEVEPGEGDGAEADPIEALFESLVFVFTDCVIGASTVCSFPAFADAQISLAASGGFVFTAKRSSDMVLVASAAPAELRAEDVTVTVNGREVAATLERFELAGRGEAVPAVTAAAPVEEVVTASAAGLVPLFPPAAWFDDPAFEELTALTVTDDGRVFGHLAEWNTCHIGIPGVCTTAPHSNTNYAYFNLGEIEVDTGDRVACGKVTLGTGHAPKHLGRQAAAEHYDDTGAVVAHVVVGEDDFGPWVAGALAPDVSAERVREFAASSLSGDWRNVNGNLELVAILAVNVPGFPVPRTRAAIVASADGLKVMALTAAGIHNGTPSHLADGDRAKLAAMRARAFGGLDALAALARGEAS